MRLRTIISLYLTKLIIKFITIRIKVNYSKPKMIIWIGFLIRQLQNLKNNKQLIAISIKINQTYLRSSILIQSKDILNEIQKTQLRLARFISLNSLRVDIDDFESIKTVHLDGYENFSLNQIKDFILRQTIQQGKSVLIKFNENENENMDQSTILRINKNYIRLYLHDRQLKKYSIQYNFNSEQ
ncbi:hypothetical protein pb186bvf_006236 [Paramecium bursaria]